MGVGAGAREPRSIRIGVVPSSAIIMLPAGPNCQSRAPDVRKEKLHTRLDVSVCVRADLTYSNPFLAPSDFPSHKRLLLRFVLFIVSVCYHLSTLFLVPPCCVGVLCRSFFSHRASLRTTRSGTRANLVLMHGFERLAYSQHQDHQPLLWKLCVVD